MFSRRDKSPEEIEGTKTESLSPPWEENGLPTLVIISLVILGPFAVIKYGAVADSVSFWVLTLLRTRIAEVPFQLLFLLFIVLLASLLYALRSTRRRIYAALEIMCGCMTAVIEANHIYGSSKQEAPGYFLPTLAGLYIIIRGIDNWNFKKPISTVPTASSK
jgi:hypothetical protein